MAPIAVDLEKLLLVGTCGFFFSRDRYLIFLLIHQVWPDVTDCVGNLLELPLGDLGWLCNPARILEGLESGGQLLKLVRIELNGPRLRSHLSHDYLLLPIHQSLAFYLNVRR